MSAIVLDFPRGCHLLHNQDWAELRGHNGTVVSLKTYDLYATIGLAISIEVRDQVVRCESTKQIVAMYSFPFLSVMLLSDALTNFTSSFVTLHSAFLLRN